MRSILSPSKKNRNYSRCPSVVGKFNTKNCEGSVKDLLGFPPKQKLLFLNGMMHSCMFPCQVECWSGIMHSLGMTDHVLPLGGVCLVVLVACLHCTGHLNVGKLISFSSPPSVKPRLLCIHFTAGSLCLTAQHKPTSVLHLLRALSPKPVILPKCRYGLLTAVKSWAHEVGINQTSQRYIWERSVKEKT